MWKYGNLAIHTYDRNLPTIRQTRANQSTNQKIYKLRNQQINQSTNHPIKQSRKNPILQLKN